ncbi:EXLDI protein [Nocardia brasiliensis]|uniref:EXLDI protein n=1 Tax=Nocardia brasiliensis TaxID=37326 RepID=UPI002455A140|nr:EXLDI protein [Nocardia brasiliensis]
MGVGVAGASWMELCAYAHRRMELIMVEESKQVEVVDFRKESAELPEVVLPVGPGGTRKQRFHGRKLGAAKQFSKTGVELVRLYVTRKGKYVVHRQAADWTDLSLMSDWVQELKKTDWRGLDLERCAWSDYALDIVDTVEELRDLVPPRIFRTLDAVNEHPPIEDLDI